MTTSYLSFLPLIRVWRSSSPAVPGGSQDIPRPDGICNPPSVSWHCLGSRLRCSCSWKTSRGRRLGSDPNQMLKVQAGFDVNEQGFCSKLFPGVCAPHPTLIPRWRYWYWSGVATRNGNYFNDTDVWTPLNSLNEKTETQIECIWTDREVKLNFNLPIIQSLILRFISEVYEQQSPC